MYVFHKNNNLNFYKNNLAYNFDIKESYKNNKIQNLFNKIKSLYYFQKNLILFFTLQKETSEAVNSIMGLTSDVIDEPESIRKIDQDDDFNSQSEYAAAKIQDLENIKGNTEN